MADTEAPPSKRKTNSTEETVESKKLRECLPGGEYSDVSHTDVNIAQHHAGGSTILPENNEGYSGNGKLQLSGDVGDVEAGDTSKSMPKAGYADVGSSASVGVEDPESLGEGEVLEDGEKEDEEGEVGGEDEEEEELSEIDTEDDSAEEEAVNSDDNDSEDSSDDEDERPTSISSGKGKGIDKGKGKEKVVDVKGKGIMSADKGKGKAKMEDENPQASDEDDAGSLSEDPLDEVDLNNILPTRTRTRSSKTHYDFVDEGNDEDDEDDDSSDA